MISEIVRTIPHQPDSYRISMNGQSFGVELTDPTVWPPNNFGAGIFIQLMHEREASIAGGRILDVGTGSGTLAVAAGMLGAEHVYALDLNPSALSNTQHNWQKNNLPAQRLTLVEANGITNFRPEEPIDMIVANLPTLPPLRTENLKQRIDASAWNENPTGKRDLVDEVITNGNRLLRSGGTVLFLQSSTQDLDLTLDTLDKSGWSNPRVVDEHSQPIKPPYTEYIHQGIWQPNKDIWYDSESDEFYRLLYVVEATRS